jgi:hypothetical protein
MTALFILAISAFLWVALTLWKRRAPANLRDIPAFTHLYRAVGLSVEEGTRLHVSLGHGGLLDPRGGSALAGLAMLRSVAEKTAVSDKPAVASAGEPVLGLLTQDSIQAGYQAVAANDAYLPTTGRVTGLTPFSYAVGTLQIAQNEDVFANIVIGHVGSEIALLTEVADREGQTMIGASDNLGGQAVLFASAHDPLIGEELFAAGAYLGAGASHVASLTVQDILRWAVIVVLLGGALAKFAGVI